MANLEKLESPWGKLWTALLINIFFFLGDHEIPDIKSTGKEPAVGANTCYLSAWKVEAGRPPDSSNYPGLHETKRNAQNEKCISK